MTLKITKTQAAAAEATFQRRWAEFEEKRAASGGKPSAHDYWTHKAIWAGAYGADAVQIVDDPVPTAAA